MLPARMLPHQITILTPGTTTDGYGNQVPDWAAATSRTAAAYVRPWTPGDENVDAGRDVSDRVWQVHTNDSAVTAFDRIVHDGVTYEIDGDPMIRKLAPGGRLGHTKLRLRRVDG